MKKYLVIIFCLIPLLVSSKEISSYEKKIHFEKSVSEQIYSDLDPLVERKYYRITAAAKIKFSRKYKGVSQRQSLPGIKNPPNYGSSGLEETVELDELKLHLFLSREAPAQVKELIQEYLETKWIAPNKKSVSLVIKEDIRFSPQNRWRMSWQEYLFIFMGLGLVAFFLFYFLRGKSQKTSFDIKTTPLSDTEAPNKEFRKEHKELNHLKEEFFKEVTSNLVVARNFIQSLDLEVQGGLAQIFHSHSLKQLIQDWFSLPNSAEEKHSDEMSPDLLYDLLIELRQYKECRQMQAKTSFGYLTDLNDKEIYNLLEEEDDQVKANILKSLPGDLAGEVLTHYDLKLQSNLLEKMQLATNGDSKISKDAEEKIYQKYLALIQRLIANQKTTDETTEMILERSTDSAALVKTLLMKNPSLKERYKKYLFGWDELISQEKGVLKETLDKVDNETIVKSLLGLDKRIVKKFYQALSEERCHVLVELEKSLSKHCTRKEASLARSHVVGLMRESLFH